MTPGALIGRRVTLQRIPGPFFAGRQPPYAVNEPTFTVTVTEVGKIGHSGPLLRCSNGQAYSLDAVRIVAVGP